MRSSTIRFLPVTLSNTPPFNQALICRLNLGIVLIFARSLWWFILSKHFAMSASRTYFGLAVITILIASMASWHDLPGLNPKDSLSNLASHSGSSVNFNSACLALSLIVGMPRGRFSCLPGLGIQTLLAGRAFPSISSSLARDIRCLLFRDFTPSTPAVFLPLFSWVTFLTAMSLAYRDLTSIFWSLRTSFTSPR